jgi:hypothetical protein
MKLIIEVPDEVYERRAEIKHGSIMSMNILKAFKQGKPLVIDDMSQDIIDRLTVNVGLAQPWEEKNEADN